MITTTRTRLPILNKGAADWLPLRASTRRQYSGIANGDIISTAPRSGLAQNRVPRCHDRVVHQQTMAAGTGRP